MRLRQKMPTQGGTKRLFDVEALIHWFAEEKREFPWRETPSPYAVWISEVMLQQTQASVVQRYFLRWMAKFPTIRALAEAPLEEVIKQWEGLGYYSRARHIHEAAHYFMMYHQGNIPSSYEALIKVKGLGRYTVGAILSFAFKQKKAAVDGNTLRVLTRYFAIREEVEKRQAQEKIWRLAEELLPEENPWEVVEGLIELGAVVCRKEPQCSLCPLRSSCLGFQQGIQRELPRKGKRVAITSLKRSVFVIVCEGTLLLKKGIRGSLMADLYEFPFVEGEKKGFPFDFVKEKIQPLSVEEHHFTRFKVTLYPELWKAFERKEVPGYEWVLYAEIGKIPFSSGHRKILGQLTHAYFTH